MKRSLHEMSEEIVTESSEEEHEMSDLVFPEDSSLDIEDTESQSDEFVKTFIVKIRQLLFNGETQQDIIYQTYKTVIMQLYGEQTELTPSLMISGVPITFLNNY